MENTMKEQAAAASAAQQSNESKALLDDTDYTDLERISESQMTALLTKREGVPTREDGTPYTYKDASPEALDNCNRQLSTCSVWRAVWSGKTSHNGNVMYKIEHAGDRYYYYRDLIKMLGAPTQRAEKSEAAKARKAAAAAAAEELAAAKAQAAAAAAQVAMYAAALDSAAKDGLTAAAVVRTLDKQAKESARAAAMQAYRDSLPQGLTEPQIELLVNAKYPAPIETEDANSEDPYDEEEESSETAPKAANAQIAGQVPTETAKGSKKAPKTSKK